jgi:hypothetical protein
MNLSVIAEKARANGGILTPSEVMALVAALPVDLDRSKPYGLRIIAEIAKRELVRAEIRGQDTFWLWSEDAEERLTVLVNWFFIEELSR